MPGFCLWPCVNHQGPNLLHMVLLSFAIPGSYSPLVASPRSLARSLHCSTADAEDMELGWATLSRSNSTISPCISTPHPLLPCSMQESYMKKCRRVLCLSGSRSDSNSEGSQMVVSISGATGFIGRRLVQKLLADNHKVRVLTRSKRKAQIVFPVENFPDVVFSEEGEWRQCIEGSTGVVNLAGMPISTRWSPEIKTEIKESRINVTSKIVDIINNASLDGRPSVLVSATAVGYYGTSETQVFDEKSPSGNDYLSQVCREWETKALEVDNGVRLVLIRIGVVLGKDGGALAKMIPLFMMFAGGPLGTGKQWFSWIHIDDLVNLICEALSNSSYKGVINGTAPHPVRLAEMCEHLGQVVGRPSWLPVPEFALKAVLGEGATIVLEGQRVLPSKAKELGFSFRYPYIKDALRAIMREL